jgi:hypothetical protein
VGRQTAQRPYQHGLGRGKWLPEALACDAETVVPEAEAVTRGIPSARLAARAVAVIREVRVWVEVFMS